MPQLPFDEKAFLSALKTIFLGGIKRLFATAASDLAKDGLARQLAEMTQQAIVSGDAERIEMLKAGVPWLLTFYKFRGTNEMNDAFKNFTSVVLDTASGLLGALGGLGVLASPTTPSTDPMS